jgi:DNA repair exonuclease SbcCD ATPase subunit
MRNMIRGTFLTLLVIAFGTCAFAQSKTPSLADAARANRKQKVQTDRTVWTNENIGSVSSKEDAAPAAMPAPDAEKAAKAAEPAAEAKKECDKTKDADCEKTEAKDKEKAGDEAAKKSDEYKSKLKDLQDNLADLQKEASLNEREWKLAQAAYYGDAGTQLRNQKQFADDQSGHQNEMQKLQKAIEDANKRIDDLKEQARKDGVKF